MAGFTQGAETTHLASAVTIPAGGAETLVASDIDLTGGVYAWMFVDCTTNASATDTLEIRIYAKTASAGTKANNPTCVLSVDENQTNYDAKVTVEAGIYDVYAVNNDATYDATVNQIRTNLFTYA